MNGAGEIGGYFEFERFSGHPYHWGALAVNCGRAALALLIHMRGIKALLLPDWLCGSMRGVCEREGVSVRTYRIGGDLRPVYNFDLAQDEWMLLVDYYGQLDKRDVDAARKHCAGRVIVDETQGFFVRPWCCCDTLYSCRKWFGVADGGYLATSDGLRPAEPVARDESHGRMDFVLGRFERPASEFYRESSDNNASFAAEPAKLMSPITENIMRAIDYDGVRLARERNWAYLDESLRDVNGLTLRTPVGPFMYPLLIDGAQEIRKYLIEHKVFIPVLWPNVLVEQVEESWAFRLSRDILPLPIDQRYGREEMDRILDLLSKAGVLVG